MGVSCMSSSDGDSTTPNPNPRNFKVLGVTERSGYTIAAIKYPNCTNFKGVKILVWEGEIGDKVRETKYLDPHFMECMDPVIARFAPSEAGVLALQELVGPLVSSGLISLIEEAL